MELGLRLGAAPARPSPEKLAGEPFMGLSLGFCMGLGHDDPPAPAPRHWDVNRLPSAEDGSPPNSGGGGETTASRGSDEDENGSGRKKLRLSKDQSAFLEESFKDHNTLNPKQKAALAKQLNLRPRQVEVWFQNRRARTKLKQTEVDCEHLKRCCEALTEENRRLHKELADLRALKAARPSCMQPPATTLSMCPSCERVSSAAVSAAAAGEYHRHDASKQVSFARPRGLFPFAAS